MKADPALDEQDVHAAVTSFRKLATAGRFDADPGPVRAAHRYVHEWLLCGRLDVELRRGNPMLVGAWRCLLRHLVRDPHAETVYEHGSWTLRWDGELGGCEMYGASEFEVLIWAMKDEADRVQEVADAG